MDWSKIKSVLIITFISINIVLGYSLYGTNQAFKKEVPIEADVYNRVVALLEEKNILVEATIESYKATVPSLTVAYETYTLEEEATKYLGANYDIIDGVAILDEEAVKIENDTAIKYFHTLALDEVNNATEESAQATAEKFLRLNNYAVPENPWRVDQQGEFLVVTYKQFYKGYYLDETYMTLEIYDDTVVRFSRKWFDNVLEKNTPKNVLPPSEALLKVIERAYTETVTYGDQMTIEKMELGYRLDDNILFSYIKSGDVFPYWRITFADGRIIYIEAVKR